MEGTQNSVDFKSIWAQPYNALGIASGDIMRHSTWSKASRYATLECVKPIKRLRGWLC